MRNELQSGKCNIAIPRPLRLHLWATLTQVVRLFGRCHLSPSLQPPVGCHFSCCRHSLSRTSDCLPVLPGAHTFVLRLCVGGLNFILATGQLRGLSVKFGCEGSGSVVIITGPFHACLRPVSTDMRCKCLAVQVPLDSRLCQNWLSDCPLRLILACPMETHVWTISFVAHLISSMVTQK